MSEKRTQNELNFERKKCLSKRKRRFRVPGFRCQGQEEQVSGVRGQKCGCLGELCGPPADGSLPAPSCSPECPSGNKSPQRGRLHTESSGSLGRGCYFSTLGFRLLDFEKLNEQSGNVYENKGPLWKTRDNAGMCMKKSHLAAEGGNVVEKKGG